GWRAANKVVKIAGKTGTAQLAGDKNPHNWFIGYAPADNPKLSIVVLVENKEEEISIAPQIAGRILSRIFDNTGK
ncbi:MAG TPA: penicillin-binding protein 2, partial [Candidatus Aerophobetes bacterium]|nr:penicillin-binding protein 2 [Candidatus Aerophobetes bacterium]